MSRPPGSATAADLATGCGSEPILVTFSPVPDRTGCAFPTPPPTAATSTTTSRAAAALPIQLDLAHYAGLVLGRPPAGVDRPVGAVREAARRAEARAADVCHPAAADVTAWQILELERRALEPARRHEQVGSHEQLLRPPRLPDEGDDLLDVGSVPDHLPGELLVHVRSVPCRRRVAQRTDDEERERDSRDASSRRHPGRALDMAA